MPVPSLGHVIIMGPTLPCSTSKLDEHMASAALRMLGGPCSGEHVADMLHREAENVTLLYT